MNRSVPHPPLLRAASGSVESDIRFSANGRHVVYRETTGAPLFIDELSSADGIAPPVLLSPACAQVAEFAIDSTGERVSSTAWLRSSSPCRSAAAPP